MSSIQSNPTRNHSFATPSFNEIAAYFIQKGLPELEASHFFIVQEARNWHTRTGRPIRNWRTAAYRWITGAWTIDPRLFSRQAR